MTTKNSKGGWELRLIGAYEFGEASSALQKMIRRGCEYEACMFAYIFHQSGFGPYLWRRLSIIACEDIGNGTPLTSILVDSLASSWERLHKNDKAPTLDKFLLVTNAILFMCRANKSRENDSLTNLIEENWKNGQRLAISEIAKDPHVDIGRKKWGKFGDLTDGKEEKRIEMWFSQWAKVNKTAYPDKWEEKLKSTWLEKAKSSQALTSGQSPKGKSTADRD